MPVISLPRKAEHVDDYIIVLEGVLFAEVTIVLGIPEAARTHVESAVPFLEDNHIGSKLKIFVNLLQQLDDHFAGVIAPLLGFLWVIDAVLEGLENEIVNLLLDG